MGLVPVGTGSAQQQFGRLHVGSQDCWILLGSSRILAFPPIMPRWNRSFQN